MLRSGSFLLGSGLLVAFSVVACSGDSLTTPGTTTLQITTSTAGTEPDPDGYTVQVDAGASQAIGSSASIQSTDVIPGDHAVQLAGIAPNCTVSGDNPRTVSVGAGQTATVSFSVACSATTGGLQVTSTTSGPAPDADGYTVTVDGAEHGILGASGAVNVDGLAPGDHVVGVSGVAANCQVQGENPRTVSITPGAAATTTFTVSCAAPPPDAGTLRVKTATTGADLDADGYDLAVDGGKTQPIGVNGTAALANIAGGNHSVKLSRVASNCTVEGANPLSANVSAGATTDVSFAISCGATSGTVKVNVATTGSPTDPDGYLAKLDSKDPGQPLTVTGSTTFVGVPAGAHTVALSGVATGCSVTDGASKHVTVSVGANTDVSFAVTCSSTGATHWAPIPLPANIVATSVWASSPSDVFVTGYDKAPCCRPVVILHYDGTAWTEQLRRDGVSYMARLWGNSATDVYATVGTSEVLRYAGGLWVDVGPGEFSTGLHATYSAGWGTSADLFAGGLISSIPTDGIISHYDGVAWNKSMQGHSYAANGWVYKFSGTSSTDVWAIGETTSPGQDPQEQWTSYAIDHYDGQAWTESLETKRYYVIPGNYYSLTSIWAVARNDVFAVASDGRMFHFNGTAWSPMASPTTQTLADVWGISGSKVYAVGAGGIFLYDGAHWSMVNPTAGTGVWGTATDVFVITDGAVLHETL